MNLSAITLFGYNFKQLSVNSIIEAAKFEPWPTFENNINEIKDNHLEIIASAVMNVSGITLFDGNLEQLSMNIRIEAEKFEPEPTFGNNINEIKYNPLKGITIIDMNLSSITSNKLSSSSERLKLDIMP